MMTPAYHETYLKHAMASMGEAFDYAINDCKMDGDTFVKQLIGSSIASHLEHGEADYLVGKSGIELAQECVLLATGSPLEVAPKIRYSRSPEYWSGWAIAYYQWYSSRTYREIFSAVSFNDLLCLYPTLHEADITKFADVIDQRVRAYFTETNLKRLRTICGYSQSELAKLSGVSLRSIQMYEQRQKDINKASALTLYNLAKLLGCSIEDLIEK